MDDHGGQWKKRFRPKLLQTQCRTGINKVGVAGVPGVAMHDCLLDNSVPDVPSMPDFVPDVPGVPDSVPLFARVVPGVPDSVPDVPGVPVQRSHADG